HLSIEATHHLATEAAYEYGIPDLLPCEVFHPGGIRAPHITGVAAESTCEWARRFIKKRRRHKAHDLKIKVASLGQLTGDLAVRRMARSPVLAPHKREQARGQGFQPGEHPPAVAAGAEADDRWIAVLRHVGPKAGEVLHQRSHC